MNLRDGLHQTTKLSKECNMRKSVIILAAILLLTACVPAQGQTQPSGDTQGQIETSVALTVAAQGQIGTSVALTVAAQNPTATSTATFTPTSATIPTITPVVPTVTPLPPPSGGSGARNAPQFACSWSELKPRTNVFSPGDAIDVVWLITNIGTEGWPAGKDLSYVNGTKMSSFLREELPALDPGDSVTVSFDANAPLENGLYGMQFKVEGGLCWPALNIQVGRHTNP
jgi:hypothetical protein